MIATRPAQPIDALAMCRLINPIIVVGSLTGHQNAFTPDRMARHYIAPQLGIACTVALDGDILVGFQALEWCDPDWPGPGRLPSDWAIIASFVAIDSQGKGIGRALWAETLAVARAAGVVTIDATIRETNRSGLAYYSTIGFTDYRRVEWNLSDGTAAPRICKRFDL